MNQYSKKKSPKARKKGVKKLIVVHPNAAGIDLGSKEHYVAVPPGRDATGQDVRKFATHTPGIREMAKWLVECEVETVAMESTGVYWIPVYDILEEAGLEVKLVHAAHLKYVPGRKSDVLDCEWIQQIHAFGLLRGCYRPPENVLKLRTLTRHRKNLINDASRYVLLMQKAMVQMNVLVHEAVSDITGKTGMQIIRAITNGVEDPKVLAEFRHARCQKSAKEIEKALSGNFRADYIFTLKQALQSYDHIQGQIIQCDRELETVLADWEPKVDIHQKPLPSRRGRKKPYSNEPLFDLRKYLYEMAGVDLTQVEGIQACGALEILSEHGADMSAWEDADKYTSWLGLCPGSRVTGGKSKSGQTRKVVNRVASAYRMAASTLWRSQGPLGQFYRRMSIKLDRPQVITAVAHKLARIVYSMLKNQTEYNAEYHRKDPNREREKALKRLQKMASKLHHALIDSETGEVIDFKAA